MLGLYDSGVGGLNILQALLKQIPNISFQYLADTDVLPLGDKNQEFIKNRVQTACEFLFQNGCEIIILACNTASVNSIRYLQNEWLPKAYSQKKILGVTKPLMEYLSEENTEFKNKKGLLLSTKATHQSGFYQSEITKIGFSDLTSIPVVGLADSIEKNDQSEINKILEELIISDQIKVSQIEYLVLACTHYNWARSNLQNKFSKAKVILDPSNFLAKKYVEYLGNHPEYKNIKGYRKFWVTGDVKNFKQASFLSRLVGESEEVANCNL